jgi:crotonobetaine/carnitine-CoA ligase
LSAPVVDLIGNRTLTSLLAERAELHADKVALVFDEPAGGAHSYTYGELHDTVGCLASGFAGLGVGAGDKVVVHLANCPAMVLSFFALARLGAVAVPSNTASTAVEMTHIAGWSDARLVITSADHLDLFEEVLPSRA